MARGDHHRQRAAHRMAYEGGRPEVRLVDTAGDLGGYRRDHLARSIAPGRRAGEPRDLYEVVAIARHRRHRALPHVRSEEHTSELQSLMLNSYAVFCLQKKKLCQ